MRLLVATNNKGKLAEMLSLLEDLNLDIVTPESSGVDLIVAEDGSTYEENAALKAAKSMGLGICGVDLLQSNIGPLILEVNSSPGLEGIESATGKNIAKSIIRYVERHA